jgi:type III secretion protein Q
MSAVASPVQAPQLHAHDRRPWQDLLRLSPVQARTRNHLVRWCSLAPQRVTLLDEMLVAGAGTPLACYPVTLHLRSSDGDLQLGCDLAALFPEMARDMLPPLQTSGATEHIECEYLTWMLAPWIDCLTHHLGQELLLSAIVHEQRWDSAHWAMQIWRMQARGPSGTLGLTGSLLPRLAAALPRPALRYEHLAHIPITLHWRVKAPELSHAQLQKLAPNSIILLQNHRAELCLAGKHGVIRLSGDIDQGEFFVNDTHLANEDTLTSPGAPAAMIPLDMIMASIDVILDSIVMPLSEIAALAPGAALPLSQFDTGRAVTLRCNGAPFARGEVIIIGERLGVLITHKAGVLSEFTTQPER